MPQSAPTQANDGGAPSAAAAKAGKAAIKDAAVATTTNKKTVKTPADGGQANTPSPSEKAAKRSAGRPAEPALPDVVKMLADFKGASSTHPRFFGQERYTQTKAVGRLVDRVKGEMDKAEDPLEEDKFKKAKKSLEILSNLMKGYTQSKGAGFLKAYQEAESWAAMEPAVDLDFVPRWMSSEKSRSQLAAAKPKDFWLELSKDNMLRIGFEQKDLDAEWVGIISDKVVDICRSESLETLPRALGEPPCQWPMDHVPMSYLATPLPNALCLMSSVHVLCYAQGPSSPSDPSPCPLPWTWRPPGARCRGISLGGDFWDLLGALWGPLGGFLGATWGCLDASSGLIGSSLGGFLEGSRGLPGSLWEQDAAASRWKAIFEISWGPSGGHLGGSWEQLGAPGRFVGASWEHPGALWGALGGFLLVVSGSKMPRHLAGRRFLRSLGGPLGGSGGFLGFLGVSWDCLDASLGLLGSALELSGGLSGASWRSQVARCRGISLGGDFWDLSGALWKPLGGGISHIVGRSRAELSGRNLGWSVAVAARLLSSGPPGTARDVRGIGRLMNDPLTRVLNQQRLRMGMN